MHLAKTLFRHTAWSLLCITVISGALASGELAQDEVTPTVEQLYAKAKAAQGRGDNTLAIQEYRAMIKLAPHLAQAYNNLGMLYYQERDFAQAEQILKRGLELDSQMATASTLLGLSYLAMGMNEEAEPILRKALKKDPSDDNLQISLVRALVGEKKYLESSVQLARYLEQNPKNQEAWYLAGKVHLQLATEDLERVKEIDPNSVVAHEFAGEIYEKSEKYNFAILEYKQAIDQAPNQPGTHMHMGNAYWMMSKMESAQAEFKLELANNPYSCEAHWKLGDSILIANGPEDEALTELNRAVELCPRLMQARVDRARIRIHMGKSEESIPDLLMAEGESPKEPTIHFYLANAYKALGKTSEGQQEMRVFGQLEREAREAVSQSVKDATAIREGAH